MLVTPTGFSKADATFESLVCMDMNGDVLEGNLKPASKRFMHLAMYRQHSGIDGVAHGPRRSLRYLPLQSRNYPWVFCLD